MTTSADGKTTVVTPVDAAPKWIEVAGRDDAATAALERLRDPDSWGSQYNVYEIIRDDVGGDDAIANSGWGTKSELTRFKRTACSPKALGRKARHGVQSEDPPNNPMKPSEASTLIRRLVRRWLDAKASEKSDG
jgi:hypothetical protein